MESQKQVIEQFEKQFIKTGKFQPNDLRILKDIVKARSEFKKGKLDSHSVNDARKNASVLINDLVEYNQRCDIANNKNKEDKKE